MVKTGAMLNPPLHSTYKKTGTLQIWIWQDTQIFGWYDMGHLIQRFRCTNTNVARYMVWKYDADMIWFYDTVWYDDLIWYDNKIWYGMIWSDTLWYDMMIWFDMRRWYGMTWHDMMIWYLQLLISNGGTSEYSIILISKIF